MISVNYRDPRPLYVQIKQSVCKLILSGSLAAGSKLPSVRELAVSLAINPNTIQRAYRELESEGYIVSITGKGSFVTQAEALGTTAQREAVERFCEAARTLQELGFDRQRLMLLIDEAEERECHP